MSKSIRFAVEHDDGGILRKRSTDTQSAKFIKTARELGCDEDPETFKRVMKQIARPKKRQHSSTEDCEASERRADKPQGE